tara:strand:+ start:3112 stop:5667 length:2556 start_codon:yes stop_codon:yes gene_type:complete
MNEKIKIAISFFAFFYINFLFANYEEPYSKYKIGKNYYPLKINQEIIIDGIINDSIWGKIDLVNNLEQAEPKIGTIPTKKTDVKICYNEDFLYVAVFLFDNMEEVSYKSGDYDDFVTVFDSISDYFIIELDTYHDHQTSYAFAVNSSGVKADYMIYDDEYYDDDWNMHWNANVHYHDNGWSIEYEIPYNNLKFNNGENIQWGMNIIRYIKNNNEYISWVVVPQEKIGVVSKYGHLLGLNLYHKRNISIIPHVLYGNTLFDDIYFPIYLVDNTIELSPDIRANYEQSNYDNIGFDIKYSINSNSMIDFTYNPDFEQINQDPSEVNNTPYETFFEEKRNFFLEDALFFQTPIKVFYSRRIGGDRQYDSDNSYFFFKTSLNLAAKYTYKNDKSNYAALLSYSKPSSIIRDDSFLEESYNEKSAIFRFAKSILNNQSKLGLIGTDYSGTYNKSNVYAYDYSLNFLEDKLFLDGQSAYSINGLNNGRGNYFEFGYRTDMLSIMSNEFYLDFWYKKNDYNKSFNIDDLGYLFRNNIQENSIGFSIQRNQEIFKSKYVIQHYLAKNYNDDVLSDIISFNYDLITKDNSYISLGFSTEFDHYNDKFYDDFFNLDLEKTIKKSNNNTIHFIYENNTNDLFSYMLIMKKFINQIKDEGQEYIVQLKWNPINWVELDFTYDLLSYYETYHFLKIRNPNKVNIIRSYDNTFQYIFTNSDNIEEYYTAKLSTYIDNFTFQLYTEYFVHKDQWKKNGNQYYVDENFINYNFPNINTGESLIGDKDYLLYTAYYTSGVLNFALKWDFLDNSSLYFLYSINKIVNGEELNSLKSLLNFKHNDINNESLAEIYYDNSFFIKCEFYFNY